MKAQDQVGEQLCGGWSQFCFQMPLGCFSDGKIITDQPALRQHPAVLAKRIDPMKAFVASVLMLIGIPAAVFAQQAATSVQNADRPTDDSIRQLLQIMQARKIVEQLATQMDAIFTATINRQLEGKTLSDEDRQRIADAKARMKEVTGGLLKWEVMEPIYLKTYGDTFSQSEVDSLIGFYSSPAGQSIIAKLPLATQNAMAAVQQHMMTLMPKVQQIAKDTATQINTSQHEHGTKRSAG